MTTRVLKSKADVELAKTLLDNAPLPSTMTLVKGKRRTEEQNRLQRLWLNEAAEQLGDHTAEEYRGYCKLHFGVPILRGEDEEFREKYDRIIRPHSYEDKMTMMMLPLDFPVTRLMKTGQKKRYLDDVYVHFTGLGVKLTDPEDRFLGNTRGGARAEVSPQASSP